MTKAEFEEYERPLREAVETRRDVFTGLFAATLREIFGTEGARMADRDWKAEMAPIVEQARGGDDRGAAHAFALGLLNERINAEGVRGKVWGAMQYRCERCGLTLWYELEVGVEGPPAWRDDFTYIACPFGAGRCPKDNAPMTHVAFKEDEHFDPIDAFSRTYGRDLIRPEAWRVFRVPSVPWPHTLALYEDGRPMVDYSTQPFLMDNPAAWKLRPDRESIERVRHG